MAKKKDITRNPPSWIEKGLFIVVILAIVAIAFPLFWGLNENTRALYACAKVQSVLSECIDEWKEETNADEYDPIPYEELLRRYQEKTGNSEFPSCPSDEETKLVREGDIIFGIICPNHNFDHSAGK